MNFTDVYIYVPSEDLVVFMQEGSGDQLLAEDVRNGYVDYVDFSFNRVYFEMETVETEGYDGGIVMYTEMVQDKFDDLLDAVPDVLEMLDIPKDTEWILLKRG